MAPLPSLGYYALRPDGWKLVHPEAFRIYRAEERLSRAEAKAEKRGPATRWQGPLSARRSPTSAPHREWP